MTGVSPARQNCTVPEGTQGSGKTKAIRVTGRQQRLKPLYGMKSIPGQWYS